MATHYFSLRGRAYTHTDRRTHTWMGCCLFFFFPLFCFVFSNVTIEGGKKRCPSCRPPELLSLPVGCFCLSTGRHGAPPSCSLRVTGNGNRDRVLWPHTALTFPQFFRNEKENPSCCSHTHDRSRRDKRAHTHAHCDTHTQRRRWQSHNRVLQKFSFLCRANLSRRNRTKRFPWEH